MLHYRYRFDPLGLNQQERDKLKSATQAWLTQYQEFSQQTKLISS
jgi:protein-glutamine gamma-glutamyltransferase